MLRLRGLFSMIIFFLVINSYGVEIIGEWTFDDHGNPGKAATGVDAVVYGKPTIEKGVFGKALRLHGAMITDKKTHDYLDVPNDPKLNLGKESFSVECWVKADYIGYYQFVGKRTSVVHYYNLKGWGLGMDNGGRINFIVDDGTAQRKGQSLAQTHFLSCDWDTDEWNYLVGVRDTAKKEVRLYINGNLVAKSADKTGDISNNESIRIGYDEMAGIFMDGKLDDIRITKGVLSEKQIKSNFSYRLNLLPQPQKMSYSKEIVSISDPIEVLLPAKPTPMELTTFELIKTDFQRWFGFEVSVTKERNQEKGTLIILERTTGKLHKEGYTLEKKNGENVIRLSSADNGIIYGALTLIQVLKKTTAYNNDSPGCPNVIMINDYPLVANRIVVSGIYFPFNQMKRVKRAFDIRMRERLNGVAIGESKSKKETPEAFKALVDEATKRGITVWAVFGYRGGDPNGLSPLNPAHVKRVRDFFDRAGKAGCRAFSFYFDDIVGREAKLVLKKEESAKFQKKIGLLQREFIKIMVDEGKKFNITEYVVCPTPYMRGWENSVKTWWGRPGIEYDQYFKELTDAPGLEKVRLYHCEFYPEKLKELREKGLGRYAYWVNGLWSSKRWFSWNVGPMRLAWTWYGFEIDPEKGPVPLDDSEKYWRNIANETDTVILGTGGGYDIAGIWLWNPPAFNDDEAARAASRRLFGKGSWKFIEKYARGMAPLVPLFKTYKTSACAECHPPVGKLKTPLSEAQLRGYWDGLMKAKSALAKLKDLPAKQKSVFDKSEAPGKRKRELSFMDDAIAKATIKLRSKLKRNGIDVD